MFLFVCTLEQRILITPSISNKSWFSYTQLQNMFLFMCPLLPILVHVLMWTNTMCELDDRWIALDYGWNSASIHLNVIYAVHVQDYIQDLILWLLYASSPKSACMNHRTVWISPRRENLANVFYISSNWISETGERTTDSLRASMV